MKVVCEWINSLKEICRIRFDVETNMNASNHSHHPLWRHTPLGEKLKIYDSAYDRAMHYRGSRSKAKYRGGSCVFIDHTLTMPEMQEAIKEFMIQVYGADPNSLKVEVLPYD